MLYQVAGGIVASWQNESRVPTGTTPESVVGGEIHLRQIDANGGYLFCSRIGTDYKTNMPVGVGRLAVNEGLKCIQ